VSDIPPRPPEPAFQHRSAYGQIAAELRAKITAGELAADDWLTTEAELASHYCVSRVTINNAIQMLADDGYVQIVRGRGDRGRARAHRDRPR
jgi:GntR family transcriptional regulator